MSDLAIDRFMACPDPDVEARAEDILAELRPRPELANGAASFMNGWLSSSVAEFLEKPRWSSRARKRLAVDLLVARRYVERTRLAVSRTAPEEFEFSPGLRPSNTADVAVPLASPPSHRGAASSE